MSTDHHEVSDVTEVVGLFETRESLENAISEVKSVGFEDSELSLLASHDSIEVADMSGRTWREQLVAFIDELRYEQPLIASGAIFLAGGSVAATIAAIIGAAVGGIAIKEVLEEVTAKHHTAEFVRSVEAGSVILWVRAESDDRQQIAMSILNAHGGRNVHVHRPSPPHA